jgi:hypothetical protein
MKSYTRSYFGRVFIAFSQLGNAISGGNPDITISARIGQKNGSNIYWRVVRKIVDTSFYPIDGDDHCRESYMRDSEEDYTAGPIFGLVVMTIIMCISCIPISIFTWSYFLIRRLYA